MSKIHEPLLLLDNNTMFVVGEGTYRCNFLTFDEAKAIIEMYKDDEVMRCFTDREIEKVIHEYLGIERKEYAYRPVRQMRVGQDAIAFKLYITPSETQPVIETNVDVQAKKIQNIYVYCQYITRET